MSTTPIVPTDAEITKAVKVEVLTAFLTDRGYRHKEVEEMGYQEFLRTVAEEIEQAKMGFASATIAARNASVHTYDPKRDGPIQATPTADGGMMIGGLPEIPEDKDSISRRYNNWMKDVDDLVEKELGLTTIDLGDICPLADWFHDGITAKKAARMFIKAQKKEAGY